MKIKTHYEYIARIVIMQNTQIKPIVLSKIPYCGQKSWYSLLIMASPQVTFACIVIQIQFQSIKRGLGTERARLGTLEPLPQNVQDQALLEALALNVQDQALFKKSPNKLYFFKKTITYLLAKKKKIRSNFVPKSAYSMQFDFARCYQCRNGG